MYELFKAKAEVANAEVHRVATKQEALDLVLQRLRSEGVADAPGAYALWAPCPFLDGVDQDELRKTIPGLRFEVSRDLASQSRVGISQMDWAIADTGSIAQAATSVAERLVSTLVNVHIALLPTARILPELASLLTELSPATERYIALITGPSRTADIERVLTIGVHGPEQLVVVFIDEMGGVR